MKLEQFVKKHKGKKVEFDGKYDYQCVDLVQFYQRDVLNGPRFSGNAKDYCRNQHPSHYKLHKNDPWYIPPRGSIAVWNTNVGGGFGHNAVVLGASLMRFTSLDQNWPTGAPVSVVRHTYRHVSCFLIPRGRDLLSTYNGLRQELTQLLTKFPHLSH